jgi:hypothetical protein
MRAIKGPGIFLAQFLRDEEPYKKAFRFRPGTNALSTLIKQPSPKTIVMN